MTRNNKTIKWKGLNITLNYLGKFINNDFGIKTSHFISYDTENLGTPLNMNKQKNKYYFSKISINDYNLFSDSNFYKYLDYYKYFDRINTSNRISTDSKKRFKLGKSNDNYNEVKYRTLRNFSQEKQSSDRVKNKNFIFSIGKTQSKKKLKLSIGKKINSKYNLYINQNYNKKIHSNKNKIKNLLFYSEIIKPKIMK